MIIDLRGNWEYRNHNGEEFGEFVLPGTACENSVGTRYFAGEGYNKDVLRCPREKYEYVAPLWLTKTVMIDEEAEDNEFIFFAERINGASQLWVDGVCKRQIVSYCTPHVYKVGHLTAGEHTFTLCVDNRNLMNIDNMASGYSRDTMGFWSGVLGRVELIARKINHIENAEVYPDKNGVLIKIVLKSDVFSPFGKKCGNVTVSIYTPDGIIAFDKTEQFDIFNSTEIVYIRADMENIAFWDEFNTGMYTLFIRYENDEKTIQFGMREITRDGKKVYINGRQLSLRGTTDCGIFPMTGYCSMDYAAWFKRLAKYKEYGLNHVRFHAWCPPEAAFCAADNLGLYVSVEMPMWLNRDVCSIECGDDEIHRDFFMREAVRISKTYGNHPSFIMFSCGNENMGDCEMMEDIITAVKAIDKRRMYTTTSNFDHNILPCEDYLCAYEAAGMPVRIQNLHDDIYLSSDVDYKESIEKCPVGVVSFEIGQYAVYPQVDLIEKYTGNMLPCNLMAIKEDMIRKGIYEKRHEYVMASGDLAKKLYKEDVEASLRTKDMLGFELLSLTDYTGQFTSTVGMLDVFFDEKGIVTGDEWKRFCSSKVPLFKAKRIFKNTQIIDAQLDFYDFGEEKSENVEFEVTVKWDDRVIFQCKTMEKCVRIPLDAVTENAQLDVYVKVGVCENNWRVFVFCDNAPIVNPDGLLKIENGTEGSFTPVFWSPVFFETDKSCGAIIDNKHPIFRYFPTEKYPDYQWKRLFDSARAVKVPNGYTPIVEFVPNFWSNEPVSPLFEKRYDDKCELWCGFDLEGDSIEEKAFKNAVCNYLKGLN